MPSPKRTISLGRAAYKAGPKEWRADAFLGQIADYRRLLERDTYNYDRDLILRDNAICDAMGEPNVVAAEVARRAGISRQQVYNIVAKGHRDVPPTWEELHP